MRRLLLVVSIGLVGCHSLAGLMRSEPAAEPVQQPPEQKAVPEPEVDPNQPVAVPFYLQAPVVIEVPAKPKVKPRPKKKKAPPKPKPLPPGFLFQPARPPPPPCPSPTKEETT